MNDAYQKHFGQLVVQLPNSKSNFTVQKFNVILSQDEEGNGGGFAFIEETV